MPPGTSAQQEQESDTASIGFKDFRAFALSDTIVFDLNGDSQNEKAYFDTMPARKLIIVDGKTKKRIVVGSHPSFQGIADDLGWVDGWGVTRDKKTFEVIVEDSEITGDREVILQYPSLVLGIQEGGGVITFKNGNYIWIHQSC